MLETKEGRLQIISPLARVPQQVLPHPVAIDKVNPLAPGKLAEQLAHAEIYFPKAFPQGTDRHDTIVIPISRDHECLAVEGQKVIVPAAMIHVSAHQVHASWSANNHDLSIIAEPASEHFQDLT